MFTQYIKKPISDGRKAFIQALNESNIPIVIYGASNIANEVYTYIISQGLDVSAFCVDEPFHFSNQIFNNREVFTPKTLDIVFEKYNIIIGFGIDVQAKNILQNNLFVHFSHCEKIYFMPFLDPMPPINYSFILEHELEFNHTYSLLNDNLSKEIMIAYINSKLGNSEGSKLLDLWGEVQYFNELTNISKNKHHVFVDCGAFIGDTILDFATFTHNQVEMYYAFEPDTTNCLKLIDNLKKNNICNTQIMPKGVWSETATLSFDSSGDSSSSISENGNTYIEVCSIDEVLQGNYVSFIKMDVEGSELNALKGAKNTIALHMPILAICVYHKPEDLITIPQYISQFETIDKKYNLYLRHHAYDLTETVLYAIPTSK